MDRDPISLLAPLRDAEPDAPSAVSLSAAIRAGRRRRRARAALAVAGAAALVLLTVAGAAAPTLLGRRPDVPPAHPHRQFDVWRQAFRIGSAGGLTPAVFQTGRDAQQVRLRTSGSSLPAGALRAATVTVYPPGRPPAGWTPGGTPAEPVDGHRAYWQRTPVTGTGGVELAWEWTPGGWAFSHLDATADDVAARAHHVAESVRTGISVPVAVPFTMRAGSGRVTGVLTGTTPDTAGILLGGTLIVAQSDPATDPVTGLPRAAPVPNGRIAGHPAAVAAGEVTVLDLAAGWSVTVRAPAGTDPSALAGATSLVADPTEHTTWTHDPVR